MSHFIMLEWSVTVIASKTFAAVHLQVSIWLISSTVRKEAGFMRKFFKMFFITYDCCGFAVRENIQIGDWGRNRFSHRIYYYKECHLLQTKYNITDKYLLRYRWIVCSFQNKYSDCYVSREDREDSKLRKAIVETNQHKLYLFTFLKGILSEALTGDWKLKTHQFLL